MRIKDEIFCFAHLRWCHNGWASNILIVVDTDYAGIHNSKYWMPIYLYDTIEDGQNKKSHLLFSNLGGNYKINFASAMKWSISLFEFIKLENRSLYPRNDKGIISDKEHWLGT